MDFQITPPMLYAAACLVFIFSGIFCGMVRWMHMCRPYNEQNKLFYPARPQVTFFFTAICLQFPYLLNPMNENVWMYIRIFGILYYPVCFSLLFRRYFRQECVSNNWRNTVYLAIPFVMIGVLLLLLLMHQGQVIAQGGKWLMGAMAMLSMALTINLWRVARWLKKRLDYYHQNNFSNSDDFPYKFAQQVLYHPMMWIVVMWLIFITGNHWVKFVADIVCAFWMILFLVGILHPQKMLMWPRHPRINELKKEMEQELETSMEDDVESREMECESPIDTTAGNNNAVDETVKQEVLRIILAKYKEPHLQKPEVLALFAHGRKMEANRFIMQVGYYKLVNMFRLQHALLYKEAHPNATQEDIATASGFTSRFTFYKARNTVTEINKELVKDVTLNT